MPAHHPKTQRSPLPRSATRVVKRLLPTQPGTLKWSQRYGEALVCVRYRHDSTRRHRYTTVELVVETTPIRRRQPADLVQLDIPFDLVHALQLALAHRAHWDGELRLWALPRKVVEALGLASHIVDA